MDDGTSFALVVALSAALVIALLAAAAAAAAAAAITVALLRRRRRRVSSASAPAAAEEKGSEAEEEEEIRRCSWEEIERLTGNFTAEVVGVGGFSTVYRAASGGGGGATAAAAVVKVQRSGGGERRRRAFALELELLRRLRHPNIVRLLAYCDDREEESALVLEYAPNSTLHDRLHSPSAAPLPWAARARILYGVAGALAHLHSPASASASESASESASVSGPVVVVHGDVTSSNVLLGPLPRLRPILCDFGSARLGFSSSLSPSASSSSLAVAVASPGYADPFFLRTGILSKSSDVYAFGVLLLETLTGRPAVGSDGRNLTAEIALALPGGTAAAAIAGAVEGLVDPRLRGSLGFDDAAAAEAAAAAEIAARCVVAQPSLRPSMAEVRALIRERMPSAISAADSESDGPDDREGKKMTEP